MTSSSRVLRRAAAVGALAALLALGASAARANGADVPPGFTAEPVISARAAWVAQKPVGVYCASTEVAWQAFLVSINDVPSAGSYINGVTPVDGQPNAYLARGVCTAIHARIRKHRVDLPTLGAALDALTVESLHMRGEVDDGQTACDALAVLPRFLVARWGFRNGSPAFRRLIYGARRYFATQPPQYHSGTCG